MIVPGDRPAEARNAPAVLQVKERSARKITFEQVGPGGRVAAVAQLQPQRQVEGPHTRRLLSGIKDVGWLIANATPALISQFLDALDLVAAKKGQPLTAVVGQVAGAEVGAWLLDLLLEAGWLNGRSLGAAGAQCSFQTAASQVRAMPASAGGHLRCSVCRLLLSCPGVARQTGLPLPRTCVQGPALHGTTKAESVRFHDDTSTYTGETECPC